MHLTTQKQNQINSGAMPRKSITSISPASVLTITLVGALGFQGTLIGQPGLDIVQKLALLVTALFAGLTYGLSKKRLRVLAIFSICTFFSAALASTSVEVNTRLLFVSYFSISTAFILFSTAPSRSELSKILSCIAWLPVFAVVISSLWKLTFGISIFRTEYTGDVRLSGGLVPAHLAMLCVTSLMAITYKKVTFHRNLQPLLYGVLVILLLTGTRGAILASLIVLAPLWQYPKTIKHWVATFIAVAGIIFAVMWAGGGIYSRSVSELSGETFNTSGRTIAWAYFVEENKDTPLFGKGLGAVTELTAAEPGNNLSFFKTPHNEYIRYYVDLGILFGAIFLISLIMFLATPPTGPRKYAGWTVLAFSVYSITDNTLSTPQFAVPFMLVMLAWHSRPPQNG